MKIVLIVVYFPIIAIIIVFSLVTMFIGNVPISIFLFVFLLLALLDRNLIVHFAKESLE